MSDEWNCFFEARAGDPTAWRELVEKFQSRLTALTLLVTGSSAAAQDIVQDTFVRAMAADVSHRDGTLMGFLGTIAYRMALKEVKRQQRETDFQGREFAQENASPLDELISGERDRLIARAIRSLEAPHRDVLVLRFYGGHSYDEIARLLQVPLGTVKSRIFNGVKICREILKEKGVLE